VRQEPDSLSWDVAVRRYSNVVMSVPARLGLSRADAEDVFQRTWQTTLERHACPPPPEDIVRWLVSTAYWIGRDVRRRTRETAADPELLDVGFLVDAEAPPDVLLRHEREQAVRDAINELSSADRRVITELFLSFEHVTYAEAAERLGLSRDGLAALRRSVLKRLRALLAAHRVSSRDADS